MSNKNIEQNLKEIREMAETPANEWHQGYIEGAQFVLEQVQPLIKLLKHIKFNNSLLKNDDKLIDEELEKWIGEK